MVCLHVACSANGAVEAERQGGVRLEAEWGADAEGDAEEEEMFDS